MASKRDLLEAHDFNRRRLVTAFLSGAPGGREVEPVRHGRTVVGGLVLALILVAGAAVVGVLKPEIGDTWRDNGMVIGESSGSRFMMIDGTLYPIANITSARLMLQELSITYVPDRLLVDVAKGPAIGIVNAPDFLPSKSDLVQTGWAACTNAEGAVRMTVRDDLDVTVKDDVVVAESATDQSRWVIVDDRRYAVASGPAGTDVLRALGLDTRSPIVAAESWLSLVAVGSPLVPFDIAGLGSMSAAAVGPLTTVGTPVRVADQAYVLGPDGLVPLTEVAFRVYRAGPTGASFEVLTLEASELSGIPTRDLPYAPDDWPREVGDLDNTSTPCLTLVPSDASEETTTAVLATSDDPDLLPDGAVSAVDVAQGHGAVVQAAAGDGGGGVSDTTYLIDSRGRRYAVVPKRYVQAALDRLGYDGLTPVVVPRAWVDVFAEGPDIGLYLSNQVIE
jgi:type VII secretion protein EccB